MMRIATWNSQGCPSNSEEKSKILQYLYTISDIILLQECGNLSFDIERTTNILDGTELTNGLHAGAYNIRCNSCIISKIRVEEIDGHYLPSGTGRQVTGIFVPSEDVNVYNIHAASGCGGAADVVSALSQLREPLILGGDMNCTPEDLQAGGREHHRQLRIGTSTRYNDFDFAKTGYPTRGNKEYDYFIHSLTFTHYLVLRHTMRGGDHFPVLSYFDKKYDFSLG